MGADPTCRERHVPGETPRGEGWSHADEDQFLEEAREERAAPAERWRRFTPPAAVEDSMTDVVVEEGSMTRAADVTWPKDVIRKIQAGYQCLKCWEPQPEPFPKECGNPCCRYPMRAAQAHDFELEFEGDKWIGPVTSLDDEIAKLEERSARRTHRVGSSIAVPSEVNRSRGGVILPPGVRA